MLVLGFFGVCRSSGIAGSWGWSVPWSHGSADSCPEREHQSRIKGQVSLGLTPSQCPWAGCVFACDYPNSLIIPWLPGAYY